VATAAIASVGAEPLASIPNPRVRDGTWVTDMPGALRADTVARLNTVINGLEQATSVELAVVVVSSLDGMSIDQARNELFKLWGIGKKGKDNGLLLLWSTGDRKVGIEVGYGLEGVLPDGKVGAILDTYVIPRFKAGQFDEGILSGVQMLARAAGGEQVALPSPQSDSYEDGVPVYNISLTSPTALGVYGSIPAGLAGLIGFRKWRRYRRRTCKQCGTKMTRLAETADDELLEPGQQLEERIGSVDYDVWKCPSCANHFTLRYAKWVTKFDKCPQCRNRTKSSTETTIVAATTSSSGSARVNETCEFCSFKREYTKTLPRITSSSSSGGRSGGSSFGGGRSGGGGASRGY
jgi:uncharacterized protein